MKIFLDCGAWNGISIDYFRKHHKGFEIHSFEPLFENLVELEKRDTIIHPVAVWIRNRDSVRFFTGATESGTLNPEKRTGGLSPDKYILVQTIDIVEFIKDNFKKTDYIIMKLNVEGAEYDIIPYMKNRGVLDWVNEWFIQWHWDKIGYTKGHHKAVSEMTEWKPWDIMEHKKFN